MITKPSRQQKVIDEKTNDNILFHLSTVRVTEEILINKDMNVNSNE